MIDGKDSKLCTHDVKCEIIMDTGASLMATPPELYEEFIELVTQESSCDDLKTFPWITFVIEEKEYFLDPFEYILGEDSDINYTKKSKDKGFCSVGFSIFDVGDLNVWIAGDLFLTKYFSVYDREND